jgi:hypothetical protein
MATETHHGPEGRGYDQVVLDEPTGDVDYTRIVAANGVTVHVYPNGQVRVSKYHAKAAVTQVTSWKGHGDYPVGSVYLQFEDV